MTTSHSFGTQTSDFHERVALGERAISYSQIMAWLSCRHRWFLSYGLGLQPLRPSDPLALGSAVHEAIANVLANDVLDDPATVRNYTTCSLATFREAALALVPYDAQAAGWGDEWVDEATRIVLRGLSLLRDNGLSVFRGPPLDKPAVELELRVPMDGFDYFAAHLDILLQDAQGGLWLTDWKVRSQLSPPEYERVNMQHMVYAWVCRQYGIPVTGTLTIELRNVNPKTPNINKDGSVSRSAVATDWATYSDAVRRAGQNPEDYRDMEVKLQNARFSQMLFEPRRPATLERIWNDVVLPSAYEIKAARDAIDKGIKPDWISRNLHWFGCQRCSVFDACLSGLDGDDIQPILRLYQYRDDDVQTALDKEWFE